MPNEELERKVEQFEKDLNENKPKPKRTLLKYFLNIFIILVATGLAIFFSVYQNFTEIINQLASCNYLWILVIIGIMIMISLLKGLQYFCFARLYTRKYKYHQGLVIDQIGIFYNAVTPGASGGQILQAYTFKKQGIPISSAVSIMAMWSIVFQSVLILYGVASFIFKYDFINSIGSVPFDIGGWKFSIDIWPLTILGFLLNLSVILIVLLMGYWRGFHNFVMGPCINLFSKLRIVKNPDKARENLRIQVENFKIELRRLLTNIPFLILITVLIFIAMTIRFSVPYFVGLALGNQSQVATFWDSVFLCNYHQMVTGLIPIPGSAGVSEYFFSKLFYNADSAVSGFFYAPATGGLTAEQASYSMCMTALLLWRSLTFIIPLFVAGIVTAFYRPRSKELPIRDGELPGRHTFVNLQNETYIERKTEVEMLEHTQELTREAIKKKIKMLNKSDKNKANTPPKSVDTFDKFNINDGDDSI